VAEVKTARTTTWLVGECSGQKLEHLTECIHSLNATVMN